MTSCLCLAPILLQKEVAPRHFLLTFLAPEIARIAKPGQFVHVRCGEGLDPLLRRPFSLHGIDRLAGTLSLLYRVVGKGTDRLSRRQEGDVLDVMGPLGQGFYLPGALCATKPGDEVKSPSLSVNEAVVVGGGIGVAPLLPLIEDLMKQGIPVTVLLGARSVEDLLRLDAFIDTGAKVIVATDDGSLGVQGTVVDLLKEWIISKNISEGFNPASRFLDKACVYTCGPTPMLRAVWYLCTEHKVPLQVSLEERMGCGVGACLSCVCKVKKANPGNLHQHECTPADELKNNQKQEWRYARICQEGPVFWGEEVFFDE